LPIGAASDVVLSFPTGSLKCRLSALYAARDRAASHRSGLTDLSVIGSNHATMRICIDGSPLLVRSSGVKTYVYQLTQHLRAAFGAENTCIFPGIRSPGELDHDASGGASAYKLPRLGLLFLVNHGLISPRLVVPGVELFHASNLIRNPPTHCKLTATVHDVTSWLMPHLHRPGTLSADQHYADRIWSRSDGLIAVSQRSKQDAVETLGLDPKKIAVVHNGVAASYFQVQASEVDEMRDVYQIRGSYMLFVSTVEPRKNVDRLISAYEQLSQEIRHEFELLIAGPLGWNYEATLNRMRAHKGGVRYLGYVPERHLPALFASATLFAYPSLYEGFGLPVLQAMAAGTPVVTAPTGALPEVASDCAVYADPYSVDEMAAVLRRMLLSPSERDGLSERGRVRAAGFTWAACAVRTWEFFQAVVER
jgi:glycosyltransferase involved in cell wall biosynthesis